MFPISTATTDQYSEPVIERVSPIDRIIAIGLMAVMVGAPWPSGPWNRGRWRPSAC